MSDAHFGNKCELPKNDIVEAARRPEKESRPRVKTAR
jgi:hypothetical protein